MGKIYPRGLIHDRHFVTMKDIARKAILCHCIAFALLLCLIVGDEIWDLPHNVFGFERTPVNWVEAVIESTYIVVLCIMSTTLSWRLLKRIKQIEGLLPLCSYCKKIRDGENWEAIEIYITNRSDAKVSHGLCPECAKKHYPDYDYIYNGRFESSDKKPN